MGKTVEIEYYRKNISFEEYFNQGITHLVIKDGVGEISEYAFAKNSLTKLIIPKSVRKIEFAAFDGNPITELTICSDFPFINKHNFYEVLKINVEDGDYNFLEEFFSRKKIKGKDNFAKLKEINIANNRLKFSEKKRMQKLARNQDIELNFISYSFLNSIDNAFIKGTKTDSELTNMLKKIDMLCENLDCQSGYLIKEKIFKLLGDYKNNLANLKPDYYQEESILTLECTSPKDLRNNLIVSLNNLLLLLNSCKKILDLSTKMLQYYEFIMHDPDLELEEDNNFNKISEIKEISRTFENKYLVDKINDLLLNIKRLINKNLESVFSDKLDLTNQDITSYFDSELDKIYQKALFILPYKNLLKGLQFQGDSNLANVLKDLNNIFTTINNKTNNKTIDPLFTTNKTIDSLFNKYQQLVKKYIDIIKDNVSNIFYDEECISANQIETNFRQELNLILEELNKELPKILENQDLLIDIYLAKEYMYNEFCQNDNWLISIIKEILNLTNNNLLDEATIKHINTRLRDLLVQWYFYLSNKSINSIIESLNNNYGLTSNILIIKTKIISDFYEIKREVESYLARLGEYNKYSNLGVDENSNNVKTPKKNLKFSSLWNIFK